MTRYLLTFLEPHDPAPEELRRVRERLASVVVEEVTSGTFAIEGAEDTVRAATAGLQCWHLHEEKQFSIQPPHRTRLRPRKE
jgi:hypothetical protein